MDETGGGLRASISRRPVVIILLGMFLLVFPLRLFAQAFPLKAIYYAGNGYAFTDLNAGSYTMLIEQAANANGFQGTPQYVTIGQDIAGSLGVVSFNGLVYCFFANTNGNVQYVTLNPESNQLSGPTLIAATANANGTAATVYQGQIYVITNDAIFASGDGKSWTIEGFDEGVAAGEMFDAVTFYPPGTSVPPAIMVVFNDQNSTLRACVIVPPSTLNPTQTLGCASQTGLPWPSNPFLGALEVGNLVLGTSSMTGGAKAPCVQFYGQTQPVMQSVSQYDWEYSVVNQTWTYSDVTKAPIIDNFGGYFGALPWFGTANSAGQMQQSHILMYQDNNFFANPSDWMVPQYPDNNWEGEATDTSGADSDSTTDQELRSLWSLVGVVLGTPPFSLNGADDPCPNGDCYSRVSYGSEQTTEVSLTEKASATLSIAVENEIKAGIGDLNINLSYAHGWMSSHGSTTSTSISTEYTFDESNEPAGNYGDYGWAIFTAPTLMTQLYQLYAYDYQPSSGQGTYLNQDLYATSVGAISTKFVYFNLTNPAEGEITDLLQGLTQYPNSTDIPSWHQIQDWNPQPFPSDLPWTVQFESPATLDIGGDVTVQYTKVNTTVDSSGKNGEFTLEGGASFDLFEGFKSGVTVGHKSTWEQESEVQSSNSTSVSAEMDMPIPDPTCQTCYSSITVQPYWLVATAETAPWIPTGYNGNLPWCLTWNVTGYSTVGGIKAGPANLPASVWAKVQAGNDQYSITAGSMVWENADGSETPIPLTADQFDPAEGAAVALNSHLFTVSAATGSWSRRGDVWTYKTRNGVTEPFTLELDFGKQSWSFDGRSSDPQLAVSVADGFVRVALGVQGLYRFVSWIQQDASMTWSHEEKKRDRKPYGVDQIDGSYNAQNQTGNIVLRGLAPKHLSNLGDVEIRINGLSVDFPLLATTDNFLRKLRSGGTVAYRADGLSFTIDFSTGRWTASINGGQFKHGMVPKAGVEQVQVLFGGTISSDQNLTIGKHPATLTYKG